MDWQQLVGWIGFNWIRTDWLLGWIVRTAVVGASCLVGVARELSRHLLLHLVGLLLTAGKALGFKVGNVFPFD